MNLKNKFYTPKQVSELLDLNVVTIYRYIKKGELKAYKIGKGYRIEQENLEDFLKSKKVNKND